MTAQELRDKFLEFFKKNDHVIIPSASLVPSEEEQLAGKERVLFTSAGMQLLIPYLMGKPHPQGKKLANVQKCLRTDDIEQVGDAVHHTFFEMLGNWSLGDYWRDEAIRLSFEFLTKELEIPLEKLAISVFAGDEDVPRDEESAGVWENLGISKDRIFYFGKEYNWWPSGEKSGPCGPDTEMFVWAGKGDPEGKPNENPLWVEIWNDVFMEFNRKEDGTLEDLPQKNVDTGMGLERAIAVLNGKQSAYETDLFIPIIESIKSVSGHSYKNNERSLRIIADHIRAVVFILSEDVEPGKKKEGAVLRRLIRRAYDNIVGRSDSGTTTTSTSSENWKVIEGAAKQVVSVYSQEPFYKNLLDKQSAILDVLREEIDSYAELVTTTTTTLPYGEVISGKEAFRLHSTYGFSPQQLRNKGYKFNQEEYDKEFKKHQELSRQSLKGKFAGGLAGYSEVETKYHTATHLLHQALRDVLGPQVFQKGSNITPQRLRFDFSYERKMTDEEIKEVEDLVNQRIKDDLKIERKFISVEQAKELNAIGLFNEKYSQEVSIYMIGPNFKLDPKAKDQRERGSYYSAEFCGGPHVAHTAVIGRIKITKEEAVSAGIRRIRAENVLR